MFYKIGRILCKDSLLFKNKIYKNWFINIFLHPKNPSLQDVTHLPSSKNRSPVQALQELSEPFFKNNDILHQGIVLPEEEQVWQIS